MQDVCYRIVVGNLVGGGGVSCFYRLVLISRILWAGFGGSNICNNGRRIGQCLTAIPTKLHVPVDSVRGGRQ